ncbi:VOC family protein [Synechococcus sp. BO 8801]|uniref:VOC family protein n=1 Tax=Synechococcus sp. BO 8801 TaxID=169670 RepID=UPI001E43595A|nr:VOC family protein [Synechococcus sp. BO 8801]
MSDPYKTVAGNTDNLTASLATTELAMVMQNAIGWFDLYVDDMDRATAFYEAVLPHRLEPIDDPTGDTLMRGFPANMTAYGAAGALVKSPHGHPGTGGTMIYFSVNDCAVEEKRVVAAGGKILRPKFSIGPFGWVTLCMDTEGNMFGLNSMQ